MSISTKGIDHLPECDASSRGIYPLGFNLVHFVDAKLNFHNWNESSQGSECVMSIKIWGILQGNIQYLSEEGVITFSIILHADIIWVVATITVEVAMGSN